MSSQPAEKAMAVESDLGRSNYLHAIARMGQHRRVMAQQAVFNTSGVKLLEKGVYLDQEFYDRLVEHKLSAPIEAQLTVEDAVTVSSIVGMAEVLCAKDMLVRMLVSALGEQSGQQRLLAPLRQMVLPQAMAFTLTVLREQLQGIFIHSVQVALTVVFLGLRDGMDNAGCAKFAAAGLLHDVGTLYMDPQWHDTSRRITGEGRRQLMVHPMTAALMVRAQAVYPESVVRAVLEHHECMDGSGYPRGLRGEEISRMGQALLLAEVVSAFFEKYAQADAAQRLLLTLNLQPAKFPQNLVAFIRPLLQSQQQVPQEGLQEAEVRKIVEQLSAAFSSWSKCVTELPKDCLAQASMQPSAMVHGRLQALQTALFDAGSHPEQLALALPFLLTDPGGLMELVYLGREALWQLQAIIDATLGRWPELAQSTEAGDIAVLRWREGCMARVAPEDR